MVRSNNASLPASFPRFTRILFGFAVLTLIIIYMISILSLYHTEQSLKWVNRSEKINNQLETLASIVHDAEIGESLYAKTDNTAYFKPFEAELEVEQETLEQLRWLTRGNPSQQNRLNQLDSLIQQRIELLRKIVNTRKQYGPSPARQLVLTGEGKSLMLEISDLVKGMKTEEFRLIRHRQAKLNSVKRRIAIVSAISFLFALSFIIWGYSLTEKFNQRLQKSVTDGKQYADRLEQINLELEQVAAIASHDLKAPLRKIKVFIDSIEKDAANTLSEESRDYFARVQASVIKMQELVDHVLAIARQKNHSSSSSAETLDLAQLAEVVCASLEERVNETKGRVEVGSMCAYQGNRTEMTQLLQNLIENGLKYHRPDVPPVVYVSAQPTTEGGCEIRVKDNGIGIAAQNRKDVFQMFRRLQNPKPYGGTGIGLGTVKNIVERNHGAIRVESAPLQGSEFIVSLPARNGHSPDRSG